MSFLDRINARCHQLKNTDTVITHPDGKRFLLTQAGVSQLNNTTGFVIDTKPDDIPAPITNQLYLGSQDCCNPTTIQTHQITHILSIGIDSPYKSPLLTHKFIECLDLPETNIAPIIEETSRFIESATEDGGVVLVHCNAGVSRSASVVVGYLMGKENIGFQQALDFVKQRRPCARPNEGFSRQLRHLKF